MIYDIARRALEQTDVETVADLGGCADLLSTALYHTVLSLGVFLPYASTSHIETISRISHLVDGAGPTSSVIEDMVQHELEQTIETKSEEWKQNKIDQLVQGYLDEDGREYDSLKASEIYDLERRAMSDVKHYFKDDLEDYQRELLKYPPHEIQDYADELAVEVNGFMNEAFKHAFVELANRISTIDDECRDALRELMVRHLSELGVLQTAHQRLQMSSQDPSGERFPNFLIDGFADVPDNIDARARAEVDSCLS